MGDSDSQKIARQIDDVTARLAEHLSEPKALEGDPTVNVQKTTLRV